MIDISRIMDEVSCIAGTDVSIMISGRCDLTFDFKWESGMNIMCFAFKLSKFDIDQSRLDCNEVIIDAFETAFKNAS